MRKNSVFLRNGLILLGTIVGLILITLLLAEALA